MRHFKEGTVRSFFPFAFYLLPFAFRPAFQLVFQLSFQLLFLVVLFFVTSVVGVVTGSNSLITVPTMYQLGIDPRVAVATNMFGLTFMSAGGALPFVGKGTIDRRRLPLLVGLTLAGSTAGALLVLVVPSRAMPVFISISMLAVAVFTIFSRGLRVGRDAGLAGGGARKTSGNVADKNVADENVADKNVADENVIDESAVDEVGGRADFTGRAGAPEWAGHAATFALGVYGGFFSGGYVTLLTAAYVSLFRMKFVEAVATTKIVNVFSSLVATVVFMASGLVDYRLGALIAVVMFAGAFVGARVALRLDERILRRVFLATVVALALKILIFDLL